MEMKIFKKFWRCIWMDNFFI